jgi:membrane protein implicated in regulation of membrane protease activity
MRILGVMALALFFATLSLPVFVHAKSQASAQNDKTADLMDIKGTVHSDNAKITFVADEGGKSWDIVNPEALKNYVDQHVQISAHVYSDKGQIHVESVVAL